MTGSRLASGGRIDRSRTLAVTFDGTALTAHPGDTLASAILAAGIRVTGSSVLLGRPRGIMAAGSEEPTGIVAIEQPFPDPMRTAPVVEVLDGMVAAGLNGQGRLADTPDPAVYDAVHHHCEVAVVGAGPAGLAAALAAARTGVRVLLLDDQSQPGGSLLTDAEIAWAARLSAQLAQFPTVTQLARTTVVGYYHDNFLIAVQRRTDHDGHGLAEGAARQRLWRIRAGEVVLATGAHERPIVFAGNDAPGVMLAESVRTYLLRYGVLAGDRVVLFATHDDAYRVAGDLLAVGSHVVIVDPRTPAGQPTESPIGEIPTGTVLAGAVVCGTRCGADGALLAVTVRAADGVVFEVAADVLAVSGGWNPALQLYSQAGGTLEFSEQVGAFVPAGATQRVTVAGSAGGLRLTREVVDDGERAGAAAAEAAATGRLARAARAHGHVDAGVPPLDVPEDDETYPEPPAALYLVSDPDQDPATMTTHFVDLQRDVSVADLVRATGAGLLGVEHVKRYTTAGTAHDQGKTSGLLTTAVIAHILGASPGELGTTTFRPPYTPVAFAALAGRERGELFDPVRLTAAHAWQVARGAEFENVGQWKRAWYYPQPGESMAAAVARECTAARTGVAFLDGSTLGKIDVRGPDAAEFLDRLYTNRMSTLRPGSIRYGVMCGVDGMVLDDGTVFRLAADRFLITTTTGNAAKVLDWMEEWLQTEWPQLRVWCTSVTEQWATLALVGPRSRNLLATLAPGVDVSAAGFAFMTFVDTQVAGLAVRIARISFSGELAYEINVAWPDAPALFEAVSAAGQPLGITPYGTETMHVLRAEKGYPIIGQDTDGTITPADLGLGWAINTKKPDYLGKRSHSRSDATRPDRKQLVGLLPEDENLLLPEGSALIEAGAWDPGAPSPVTSGVRVRSVGHVTSAYPSVALGRTFALALLAGGQHRHGDTVHAVVAGIPRPVRVVSPVLFDPENARRDGDSDPVRVELSDQRDDPAADGSRRSHDEQISVTSVSAGPAVQPVSPLAGYAARFAELSAGGNDGIRLAEIPLITMINIRVAPGTPTADAVADALDGPLPAAAGLVSFPGRDAVLALGPDEYLVLADPDRREALLADVEAALTGGSDISGRSGADGAVTDVSGARTLVRISGRNTRQVLAHGCGIDLATLVRGTVAQSMLAQCAVTMFCDGAPGSDDDVVNVLVRSSFAGHLAQWLLLTAREYA